MFIETDVTQRLSYIPVTQVAQRLLERTIYSGDCKEQPSCLLQESMYRIFPDSVCDDVIDADYLLDEYGAINESDLEVTGLLLEDGTYTDAYLAVISVTELDKLLNLLYKLPQSAINDALDYHTYRRETGSSSIYNNIKPFQLEDYRISDHWNVYAKGRMIAPTTDGKRISKEFCLGKKEGKQWEIVKSYGRAVQRTETERQQVAAQLLDSGLFDANTEALDYLRQAAGRF